MQTTHPDIMCHKTGKLIPLDKLSCSKLDQTLYAVWCPDCRVLHQFRVLNDVSLSGSGVA
jgi:hypothetical protein